MRTWTARCLIPATFQSDLAACRTKSDAFWGTFKINSNLLIFLPRILEVRRQRNWFYILIGLCVETSRMTGKTEVIWRKTFSLLVNLNGGKIPNKEYQNHHRNHHQHPKINAINSVCGIIIFWTTKQIRIVINPISRYWWQFPLLY